jgi:glycosyltransferase involved in cell wall biosynthesis
MQPPFNAEARPLKVLFLGLLYPDVEADANLYTELLEELDRAGVEVHVVAPAVEPAKVGLRTEGGIPVLRVATGALFGIGLVRKAINNLLLPVRYYAAIRRHVHTWRPDWVITPTPPITLTPLVWWLKRKTGARSYLVLRDIFPQNAVDLGFMSARGPTHRFFRMLERWTYAVSDRIGCMSPGNVEYVINHNQGVDPAKLHLLPNWIAERHVVLERGSRTSRERWKVGESDLLCVFGGNLGKPQRVEFLVDVAEALKDDRRIRFVIVGRGTERESLMRAIAERKLENITMFEQLPRAEYQGLLASADVGIVLLHQAFTIPNIPSRLTGYWAAGVAVLAATDEATDFDEAFLSRYGGGAWVRMGNVAGFAEKLRWFAEHPDAVAEMGARGRQAVLEHFTARTAAETVIAQFGEVDRAVTPERGA